MSLGFLYNISVWVFMASSLLIPFVLKRTRFQAIINIALVVNAVLFSLLITELVARSGVLDDNHIWTPRKFIEEDRKIDQAHVDFSRGNPHGFNDKIRSFEKPADVFRVAILGDSFIFGDGVRREDIWAVKLTDKIRSSYENIEILLWGKNGWSTRGELGFLKETGIRYQPDLLLVGFVTNDPSPCDFDWECFENLTWHNSRFIQPLKMIFPESHNLISSFVNSNIQSYSQIGYANYSRRLYAASNLTDYGKVLTKLANFCAKRNLPLLMVLTPNNHSDGISKKFDKVIPLLKASGIPYLDLYPAVASKLGHLNNNALRASRADGHPGGLVTEVFADETFAYLVKHKLLPPDRIKPKMVSMNNHEGY